MKKSKYLKDDDLKKNKILELRLRGKEITNIAEESESDIGYVKKVIKDAADEARSIFIQNGEHLLAYDIFRLEKLIDSYMDDALSHESDTRYKSTDRVIKLITTKAKIILSEQKTATRQESPEEPKVFGVNSHEYAYVIEQAVKPENQEILQEVTGDSQKLDKIMKRIELLGNNMAGSFDIEQTIDQITAEKEELDELELDETPTYDFEALRELLKEKEGSYSKIRLYVATTGDSAELIDNLHTAAEGYKELIIDKSFTDRVKQEAFIDTLVIIENRYGYDPDNTKYQFGLWLQDVYASAGKENVIILGHTNVRYKG